MKQEELEFNYLVLLANYGEFIENTMIKPAFLEQDANKIMLSVLLKSKNDMQKNCDDPRFNMKYYSQLLMNNVFKSSRKSKFKEFEKMIITNYKNRMVKNLSNCTYAEAKQIIEDLEKLNVQENSCITYERMKEVLKKGVKQIETGFKTLDKNLRIEKNDFVILAGGTGTGKTSFAINLMSEMSKTKKVVYFNMEMSEKVFYQRLAALESGIEINRLNDIDKLDNLSENYLDKKMKEISDREIVLINGSRDVEDIKREITSVDTEKELVVFIDHFGLVTAKGSLYEQATEKAKQIRLLCLDNNCTIFALCQLSRESQKDERQPKLQDLRDSGEIEQSARKVLMLHNKDLKSSEMVNDVDLIVEKNDTGIRIEKGFKFNKLLQKFYECD